MENERDAISFLCNRRSCSFYQDGYCGNADLPRITPLNTCKNYKRHIPEYRFGYYEDEDGDDDYEPV